MNIFHQARTSISTRILSTDGVFPRSPRLWTHQRKFSFSIHFSTIEIAAEKKKFSRKIPNWLWNHFLSSDWPVRKQLFNNLCKKFSFRSPFPFFFLHSFFLWFLTPSLSLSISELNCGDHCENVVFLKIKKKIQFVDEFYIIISNSYSTINSIEWMSYSYKIRRTHKAIHFQNTYELLK